jgi:hypothetical protein
VREKRKKASCENKMSKLILPSPVVLASQSFDVDTSGVGPGGASIATGGTLSPLRFLVPANSTIKDSSIDVDILVTSSAVGVAFTLAPQLVFTDPDGLTDAVTYVMQPLSITPSSAQLMQYKLTIAFAQGAATLPNDLKPVLYYRAIGGQIDGSGAYNIDTGSYATGNSPTLTNTNRPRAITIQLVRVGGTSVTNVRYIRAVGYNLNMDNSTL